MYLPECCRYLTLTTFESMKRSVEIQISHRNISEPFIQIQKGRKKEGEEEARGEHGQRPKRTMYAGEIFKLSNRQIIFLVQIDSSEVRWYGGTCRCQTARRRNCLAIKLITYLLALLQATFVEGPPPTLTRRTCTLSFAPSIPSHHIDPSGSRRNF